MEGRREGVGRALSEAVREVSQVGSRALCPLLRGAQLPRPRPVRDGAGGTAQASRHRPAHPLEHPGARRRIGLRADAPGQGDQRVARVLAGAEALRPIRRSAPEAVAFERASRPARCRMVGDEIPLGAAALGEGGDPPCRSEGEEAGHAPGCQEARHRRRPPQQRFRPRVAGPAREARPGRSRR